jgi:murein DD-endopeptidase MepM/ murein hydrolase activator NlpD
LLEQAIKYIKKRFGKGFTLMLVPNSHEAVKSVSIPFSLALIIVGIVVFNIYIFVGYSTQVGQIYHFQKTIGEKNQRIAKLEAEQRQVGPALERSHQITEELSRLRSERDKLIKTWRAIQQKGGRVVSASRGTVTRGFEYTLQPTNEPESIKTACSELQNDLDQLEGYLKSEAQQQKQLLHELLAYERRLDHTPSLWPVYTRVNSWFGYRRHPLSGRTVFHEGMDIQAGYGTPVRAAADGSVKKSGWMSGYGQAIVIDHGYGFETLYGHNSRLMVGVGQQVKKGQIICYSGNSGASTGPHLHYEVHIGNQPVNPAPYMKQ